MFKYIFKKLTTSSKPPHFLPLAIYIDMKRLMCLFMCMLSSKIKNINWHITKTMFQNQKRPFEFVLVSMKSWIWCRIKAQHVLHISPLEVGNVLKSLGIFGKIPKITKVLMLCKSLYGLHRCDLIPGSPMGWS